MADLTTSSAIDTFMQAANASAARTALGLGTAATQASGDFATAAQGTDARTPTAHATSHKSGGSDAIKLDELDAPTDVTTLNATTSAHGLLPKLGGGTTNFLRADGSWAAPAGGVATDDTRLVAFAADAGSTDTYVVTLSPAPSSYTTGAHYRFRANTANTGAATVNFNGLGAKTIVKAAGGITTALADNDIRAGQWVDVVYDGTNMQMQSTLGNASGGGGIGGSTGATDNAILRADGTGGATVQSSGVTIDDGNSLFCSAIGINSSGSLNGATLYVNGQILAGGCRINYLSSMNYLRGTSGTILDDGPLVMGQISAPGTSSNTAKLYSKDVAGTSKMFIMDESGAEVCISPATTGINSITSATGSPLTLATLDSDQNIILDPHGTGAVTVGCRLRLKGYTVATLPAGTVGDTAYVTDALTPVALATVVGGGAVVVTVFYNGTNWIVQ